jgi:hypothetical protein
MISKIKLKSYWYMTELARWEGTMGGDKRKNSLENVHHKTRSSTGYFLEKHILDEKDTLNDRLNDKKSSIILPNARSSNELNIKIPPNVNDSLDHNSVKIGNFTSEKETNKENYVFALLGNNGKKLLNGKFTFNEMKGKFQFLPKNPDVQKEDRYDKMNPNFLSFAPLNTSDSPLFEKVSADKKRYKKLNAVIENHNGLCEIICNHVVMNDLLKPPVNSTDHNLKKVFESLEGMNDTVHIEQLEDKVANLHILKQVSFYQILKAAIFDIIPNNYLTKKDQKQLMNLDNCNNKENLIGKALDKIKEGEYTKFFVYNKSGMKFEGHSMLIRKNEDKSYTFFDPNHKPILFKDTVTATGKVTAKDALVEHVKTTFRKYQKEFEFKNMCFMNVQKMLPKPELKNQDTKGNRIR